MLSFRVLFTLIKAPDWGVWEELREKSCTDRSHFRCAGEVFEGSSLPRPRLCESHKHWVKHSHVVRNDSPPSLLTHGKSAHLLHTTLFCTIKSFSGRKCCISWMSVHGLREFKILTSYGYKNRCRKYHSTTSHSQAVLDKPPKALQILRIMRMTSGLFSPTLDCASNSTWDII